MSKHGMSAEIVWRNEDNSLQTWRVRCSCRRAEWTGPTYEYTEDEWRKHVHSLTGKAPSPAGKTEGRWTA